MNKIVRFKEEVESLINRLGVDSYFGIADYILADYLANQLEVLDQFKKIESFQKAIDDNNGDNNE